jgi:hypothetical protein
MCKKARVRSRAGVHGVTYTMVHSSILAQGGEFHTLAFMLRVRVRLSSQRPTSLGIRDNWRQPVLDVAAALGVLNLVRTQQRVVDALDHGGHRVDRVQLLTVWQPVAYGWACLRV